MLIPGASLSIPVVYFDDFLSGQLEPGHKFSSTTNLGDWLETSDVTPTIVIADNEPGGLVVVTTGSNGNDFASCQLNGEAFKVRADKDLYFQCRVKFDDANDTRWFVGLATTDITGTTIGPILDGVVESIGFRQNTDTGTDIYALTENTSTETTDDTGVDVADDKYLVLAFLVTSNTKVEFFVNGKLVVTHTTNIPSGDAVTPTFEVHSPTASSTIEFDYILCVQER